MPQISKDSLSSLLSFKRNGLLYKKNNNEEIQLTIVSLLPYPQTFITISLSDSKFLIRGMDVEKKLYYFDVNARVLKEISGGVLDAAFSPLRDKVLYQKENEVWVYFLNPAFGKERELITRSADPIKKSVWLFNDGSFIAYIAKSIINIAELDQRYGQKTLEYLPANGNVLYFDSDSDYLYFFNDSKFYRAKII